MTCRTIPVPGGHAIICDRKPAKRCRFCNGLGASMLCDGPRRSDDPRGRRSKSTTCDAPMCMQCARKADSGFFPDKDLCPDCYGDKINAEADAVDWLEQLKRDEANGLDRDALNSLFPDWPALQLTHPMRDQPDLHPVHATIERDAWWGGIEPGAVERIDTPFARGVGSVDLEAERAARVANFVDVVEQSVKVLGVERTREIILRRRPELAELFDAEIESARKRAYDPEDFSGYQHCPECSASPTEHYDRHGMYIGCYGGLDPDADYGPAPGG